MLISTQASSASVFRVSNIFNLQAWRVVPTARKIIFVVPLERMQRCSPAAARWCIFPRWVWEQVSCLLMYPIDWTLRDRKRIQLSQNALAGWLERPAAQAPARTLMRARPSHAVQPLFPTSRFCRSRWEFFGQLRSKEAEHRSQLHGGSHEVPKKCPVWSQPIGVDAAKVLGGPISAKGAGTHARGTLTWMVGRSGFPPFSNQKGPKRIKKSDCNWKSYGNTWKYYGAQKANHDSMLHLSILDPKTQPDTAQSPCVRSWKLKNGRRLPARRQRRPSQWAGLELVIVFICFYVYV